MSSKQRQSFTVMFVPHSDRPVFSFRTSLLAVQIIGFVLVVACLSLLILANTYQDMLANMDELRTLRQINREQQEEIRYLAAETQALQQGMRRLLELDQQIREMMALDANLRRVVVASDFPSVAGRTSSSADITTAALRPDQSALVTDPTAPQDPVVTGGALEEAAVIRETLGQLGADMGMWEDALVELRAGMAESQAYAAAKPSIWPAMGVITSTFGYRTSPFGWGVTFHEGLDISAPIGTPVLAAGDGIVVFSGWKVGYGNTMEIDHGYGFRTLYAHNQKNNVVVGQRVRQGQIIAFVGSTGRSTGPHLHYEVRLYGRLVDPYTYLGPR